MSFDYVGQISGAQDPVTVDVIVNNSVTVTVGDAVYISGGVAALATSSSDVFGIVMGIVDANGIDLDNTSSDNYDGTWASSDSTYTAAADNKTDKKVKVKVCPDPYALWENDADGDFTDPDDLFKLIKLNDEDQIDESETDADVGQFQVWDIDPHDEGDKSVGVFRIARWQGSAMEPET